MSWDPRSADRRLCNDELCKSILLIGTETANMCQVIKEADNSDQVVLC